MSVAEIRRLIEEAGRVPVERDTLYREVVREEKKRGCTGRSVGGGELSRLLLCDADQNCHIRHALCPRPLR